MTHGSSDTMAAERFQPKSTIYVMPTEAVVEVR